MCPQCHHVLGIKDLIPVLSWASLHGKCRYCSTSISWQYPAVELCGVLLFALSYAFWPYNLWGTVSYMVFAVWLSISVIFLALIIYDLRWLTLPNRLVYIALPLSTLFTLLLGSSEKSWSVPIAGAVGSLVYGGFFYVLYQLSNGRWIGGGDVRLGFVLGLILGWQKSIVSLSLAAYSASFVILILVIMKKYHRKMKLPFGPFLIFGSIVALLWGQVIINSYLRISGL